MNTGKSRAAHPKLIRTSVWKLTFAVWLSALNGTIPSALYGTQEGSS